jgi:hypothetical protein
MMNHSTSEACHNFGWVSGHRPPRWRLMFPSALRIPIWYNIPFFSLVYPLFLSLARSLSHLLRTGPGALGPSIISLNTKKLFVSLSTKKLFVLDDTIEGPRAPAIFLGLFL